MNTGSVSKPRLPSTLMSCAPPRGQLQLTCHRVAGIHTFFLGRLQKMSTMRILDFQALHHLCCKSMMFDKIQAAAKILEVTDGKTGRQIWKTLVLLGTMEIISTGYNPVLPQGKYVSLIASVNACSIELDLHS